MTAMLPLASDWAPANRSTERIQLFVADGVKVIPNAARQLEREGFAVTMCPGSQADSLLRGLTERRANLVLVNVQTSPLTALALLRAAVAVCCRVNSRSRRQTVGFLKTTDTPGCRVAAG